MTAADKIAEARVLIEPLSVQRLLVNGRLEDPARIVAALTDLAGALAQENDKLRMHLSRMLMAQDGVPLNAIEFGRWVNEARSALGDAP